MAPQDEGCFVPSELNLVAGKSTGSASSAAPYTGPALRGPKRKASNSHQRQSRDAPTAANSSTVEEIWEQQCIQQRVPHESRVHLVMPALTERVRYLLRNLNPEESKDYESVKAAVLTELKLSPAEYLQRFERAVKREEETWAQFASRVKTYF
ncbi:hypothetical protein MRX96_039941 [Rhipicephalus microplus]